MNFPFPKSAVLFFGIASFAAGESTRPTVPVAPLHVLNPLVAEIVAGNPEIAFYEAEIDAANASRRTAASWSDPELSLQVGRKRVRDTAGILAGEGAAWSVSLTQTFEWPGRLALRKSIANRQVELAELGLAHFKAALRARAVALIYGLQIATEKSAAAQEVMERYQALRELFLARDPAGITPLLETRVIEAQELAVARRATDAALAAKMALAALNQLRGAPRDADFPAPSAELVFVPAPAFDALITAAWEENFEFRMRKVELEQQGFAVSLARHERYPAVAIGPFVSQDTAGEQETIVGLGVSLPLPLGRRTRGSIDFAAARRRQAETMLLVARRDLEREVVIAAQTFEAKRLATLQWRADAAKHFRDAAELADRHFRLGAVPLATYVELQNSYLDAVEALLDTQRETLESGQRLQLLTGLDFNPVRSEP